MGNSPWLSQSLCHVTLRERFPATEGSRAWLGRDASGQKPPLSMTPIFCQAIMRNQINSLCGTSTHTATPCGCSTSPAQPFAKMPVGMLRAHLSRIRPGPGKNALHPPTRKPRKHFLRQFSPRREGWNYRPSGLN